MRWIIDRVNVISLESTDLDPYLIAKDFLQLFEYRISFHRFEISISSYDLKDKNYRIDMLTLMMKVLDRSQMALSKTNRAFFSRISDAIGILLRFNVTALSGFVHLS